MFVVLGINILIYFMAPMYALYGNQSYIETPNNATALRLQNFQVESSPDETTDPGSSTTPTTTTTSIPITPFLAAKKCTIEAPSDHCILTRMGVFLNRYFFKTWFFGAAYYWAVWVFCGTFVIGFFVSLFKPKKSAISGIVDSEDFEESDREDDDRMLINDRNRRDGDDSMLRA